MKMINKILVLAFVASNSFAAQQAHYPILPTKEEIQQAVLESEVVKTQQLIPQLAPLIAEYADNTKTVYISLHSNHAAFRFRDMQDNLDEIQKSPEIAQMIENDDWIIHRVAWFINQDGTFDSKISFDLPEGIIFPEHFPVKLLIDKKEGDILLIKAGGVPFKCICKQSPIYKLLKNGPVNFEDAIKSLNYIR
jgi:hypothetical protein